MLASSAPSCSRGLSRAERRACSETAHAARQRTPVSTRQDGPRLCGDWSRCARVQSDCKTVSHVYTTAHMRLTHQVAGGWVFFLLPTVLLKSECHMYEWSERGAGCRCRNSLYIAYRAVCGTRWVALWSRRWTGVCSCNVQLIILRVFAPICHLSTERSLCGGVRGGRVVCGQDEGRGMRLEGITMFSH